MPADPAAVLALAAAIRAAGAAAAATGQRTSLAEPPVFPLVVLGCVDVGKTALISALLADALPAAIPPTATLPAATLPAATRPAAIPPAAILPAAMLPAAMLPAAMLPAATLPAATFPVVAIGGSAAFAALRERPGRGTTVPVEYGYGPPELLLGIGGTASDPARWLRVPPETADVFATAGLRRVRVRLPTRVLLDWHLRIVECPGFDAPPFKAGPDGTSGRAIPVNPDPGSVDPVEVALAEARRPGAAVLYVVSGRGVTDVDTQVLELLRGVPVVMVENLRETELTADQPMLEELPVYGLSTASAVPMVTRRVARSSPERDSLRRCVALLWTLRMPGRWPTEVAVAADRSRDALRAGYADRLGGALARVPVRPVDGLHLDGLHLAADLLRIERDGPGIVALEQSLARVGELAREVPDAARLREIVERDARTVVDRYHGEAARHGPPPAVATAPTRPLSFGNRYADVRRDLLAVIDSLLADGVLRLTGGDREALGSLRDRLLADRLELTLLGQFSSGKSSLINALLGRVPGQPGLLPVKNRPTTTTVNRVEYDEQPIVRASWLPRAEVTLLSVAGDDERLRVHHDEIQALDIWLREGAVRIEDCTVVPADPRRSTPAGAAQAFRRLCADIGAGGTWPSHVYLPSAQLPDRWRHLRLSDPSPPMQVRVHRFATVPDWPGRLDRQAAFAAVAADPSLALRLEHLRIGFDHPLLPHVTIVDTPGTDSAVAHHRRMAHGAIKDHGDGAVVYCFNGGKPGGNEDDANLRLLRDAAQRTGVSRFFFVLTRVGGLSPAGRAEVVEVIDRTLDQAGVARSRLYVTELSQGPDAEFHTLVEDLSRFVMASKGPLVGARIAGVHRIADDAHRRYQQQIDDLTQGEQSRLRRVAALTGEQWALAGLRDDLATSTAWGEPWLWRRLGAAISAPAQEVGDDVGQLADRPAFDGIESVLAGDLDELNRLARRAVQVACEEVTEKVRALLAEGAPGRRISVGRLSLGDDFFASAGVVQAVRSASWRTGWQRFKELFADDGRRWDADVDLNRARIGDAWQLSSAQGTRAMTAAAQQRLDEVRIELRRLSDGVAEELDVVSRPPAEGQLDAAIAARDRAAAWLARLQALDRALETGEGRAEAAAAP